MTFIYSAINYKFPTLPLFTSLCQVFKLNLSSVPMHSVFLSGTNICPHEIYQISPVEFLQYTMKKTQELFLERKQTPKGSKIKKGKTKQMFGRDKKYKISASKTANIFYNLPTSFQRQHEKKYVIVTEKNSYCMCKFQVQKAR